MKRLSILLIIFFIIIAFAPQAFAGDVAVDSDENDVLEMSDVNANVSANKYWYESMPTEESESVNYNGGNQDIDFHTTIDDYFGRSDSTRYFGALKLYAYVNDDTANRVELKDYDGAATYIKFNLNLVESQLNDGENKITVHPDESQMYSFTCWQYNFIPALVYYNTDSYEYTTTPYPSSIDYVIGDNKIVDVDITYNDSLSDIINDLDFYVYINDENTHKLVNISGNKHIKFNLYEVKDYLTEETNVLTFHHDINDGLGISTLYNKLTVNIVEPIYDYYITTPDPSYIDEYVRKSDEYITVYTQYWEGLAEVMGWVTMAVYINDVEGYNWDFIRGIQANETEFTFNLKDISSQLEDGKNTLYFAPYRNEFNNLFQGDNYTFNPLIVYVKKSATTVYDYISTPIPSEIYYKSGEDQIIEVNISYPDTVDLSGYSMFVYINGEEFKDRVAISGVDSGDTSFTFNLKDVSDKLVDGVNNLTFHPNTGMLEYDIRGDLIFNPLRVVLSEGIINTTLSVNPTLNVTVNKTSQIKANYTPSTAKITYVSDDESIAKVDENGLVTGVKEGIVNITVSVGDDNVYSISNATVCVYVNNASLVNTSISVAEDSIVLNVSDNVSIVPIITPEGLNVTYVCDGDVIEINDNVITALKEGSAIVTLTVGDNVTYQISSVDINVTVLKIKTSIDVNDSIVLNVSDNVIIVPVTTPEGLNIAYDYDGDVIEINDNVITALKEGSTIVTLTVGDNVTYEISSVDVNVTVLKIKTSIDVNDSIVLNVSDNVSIVPIITPEGLNVTYVCDGDVIEINDNVITALKEGSAIVTLTVGDNVTYEISSVDVNVTVLKIKTSIDVNDSIVLNEGDVSKLNVNLTPSNAKGTFSYFSYNTDVVTIDENGTLTAVSNGTALVSIIFKENNKYLSSEATVNVIVLKNIPPKFNLTIEADANEIIIGNNATVIVTGFENATGNVTLKVGDSIYTKEIVNESVNFTVSDLKENVTAFVFYEGDDNYNNASTSVDIVVKEKPDEIISAPDVIKYYGGPERFVVSVRDYEGNSIANKSVSITINGITYYRVTDNDGNTSIAIGLNSGNYNITVDVDNKTINSTVTVLSTVNGTNLVKVFRNASQYYATFRDSQGNYLKEGTMVRFNINGVYYDRQIGENGLAKLNINLLQGTYILTAINLVTGEETANNITVIPKIVENKDLVKYFRNDSQYRVKIIGDDGNPVGAGEVVTFNINGVYYNRITDENGFAQLNINLNPGKYIITVMYGGNVVSNVITVLSTLQASDISMSYRDGTQFAATLFDGQGNLYSGQNVIFNINGVFYNRLTDADGIALLNINLLPGEYIITSAYNGLSIGNTITIH